MKKPTIKNILAYINNEHKEGSRKGPTDVKLGDMIEAVFEYSFDPEAYDEEEYGSADKAERAYSKDVTLARKNMLITLQKLIMHFQPKKKVK